MKKPHKKLIANSGVLQIGVTSSTHNQRSNKAIPQGSSIENIHAKQMKNTIPLRFQHPVGNNTIMRTKQSNEVFDTRWNDEESNKEN